MGLIIHPTYETIEWNPKFIPDCGLWLEADRGVVLTSSKVSAWVDQSGNGRNFAQTNSSYRPTVSGNVMNEHPSLFWSSDARAMYNYQGVGTHINNDLAGLTIFAVTQLNDLSIPQPIVVFQAEGQVGKTALYAKGSVAGGNKPYLYGRRLYTDDYAITNTTTTGNLSAHVIGGTIDYISGAMTLYQDGVNIGTGTLTSSGSNCDSSEFTSEHARLCYGNSSDFFSGYMSALIIYQRVLTINERDVVNLYLGNKYGIEVEFDPLQIPDCAMWFDSDRGITLDGSNKVQQMNDLSGNARHAYQETPTSRPAYITGAVNSHAAVRSGGTTGNLIPLVAISCTSITGICVRLINTNTNSYPTVYSVNFGSYRLVECYGTNNGGGTRVGALNSTAYTMARDTTTPTTGVYEITTVVFDGVDRTQLSSWRYRVNGVERTLVNATGTSSDGGQTTGKLLAHPYTSSSGRLDGDIVALIIYSRNLSTAEIQFIERGLGNRYAIEVE